MENLKIHCQSVIILLYCHPSEGVGQQNSKG